MVHMISWGQAKNNDIINVAFGKTKTHQHLIHDPLKFCRGIFQTKQKKLPLAQTILPMGVNSPKNCFDLITFPQWQFMVGRHQIQGTENLGLSKGIKDLL